MMYKKLLLVIALIFGLAALAFFALTVGAVPVENFWQIIAHPQDHSGSANYQIIWQIRAPRVATAIMVGIALSVAGAIAQSATNNPIADPSILGTAAGASLGVLIAIALNLATIGSFSAVGFAALGAFLATLLTFWLAKSSFQLIVTGIAISAMVTAVVGIAISAISRPDARSISFWSLGSLALTTHKTVLILLPIVLIGCVLAYILAPQFDLLVLGDPSIRFIGKNPQQIRFAGFLLIAFLVSASVSSVGTISFLALAAPHIARYLVGPIHRWLIPIAALIGGLILLGADTAARTLAAPNELPIGLITSLIGAPFLIYTVRQSGQTWR